MRSFLLVTAFAFAFISPAHAADEKKAEKPAAEKSVVEKKAEQKPPVAKMENTPLKKWIDAENKLIDPLSDKEKESFFILRNKYSVHRVIKIVERDVGNAVKSCGKNNPDMKEKIDARFKQWTNAVDPILETAKKQVEKEIDTQTMVDAKEARAVLKLNDEAYEFGEKQITKQPVSTKEACEDLIASMDRTEDDMVKLLQETLLPESVIRKRAGDMQKAKKAAAEKQAVKTPEQKAPEKAQAKAGSKTDAAKEETKAQ